jgi:hypothetical protein
MCGPLLGGGAPHDNSREIEQQRQARINQGMQNIDQTFGQFTPDYYTQFQQTAFDQMSPDIEKQYKDAVKSATYSLARGGNLRSSAGADFFGDLQEAYDRARLEANDRARSMATDRRSQVESTRGNLVSQLNATADPAAAAQSAINQAQLLTTPPAYSPIGNVFAGLTAQVADAQAQNRAGTSNWATDLLGPYDARGSRGSITQVG